MAWVLQWKDDKTWFWMPPKGMRVQCFVRDKRKATKFETGDDLLKAANDYSRNWTDILRPVRLGTRRKRHP